MTGTIQDENLNAELTKLEKKYNLFAGLSALSLAVVFFLFLFISQDWQYKILAMTLIFAIISSTGAVVYHYKYLKRHGSLFSNHFSEYNRRRLHSIARSECPNCGGEKIIYVEWRGKTIDVHTRCIRCDYDYSFSAAPMAIQFLFTFLPIILLAFGLYNIFGYDAVGMDTTVDVSVLILSMIYCLLMAFTLPWAANAAAAKTQFAKKHINRKIISNLAHEERLKNDQYFQETIKERYVAVNRLLLATGIISFVICLAINMQQVKNETDGSRYIAPVMCIFIFIVFLISNRMFKRISYDIEDIQSEQLAYGPQIIQVMMLAVLYFMTLFMLR